MEPIAYEAPAILDTFEAIEVLGAAEGWVMAGTGVLGQGSLQPG